MNIKYILPLLFFFLISCQPLYYGISFDKPDLNTIPEENLSDKVENWEDGTRISGKRGEYEWWYLDAMSNDGTIVVIYFWRVHFTAAKHFIGYSITTPDGKSYFDIKYFKDKNVSFEEDSCNVQYDDNHFIGNLKNYSIKVDPFGKNLMGANLNLESHSTPYRPKDGLIRMGDDYFAWLSAVPNGSVNGEIFFQNDTLKFSGHGYHDHNWSNAPFQQMMDSWYWARGTSGDLTYIGALLNIRRDRGNYKIPILMVSKNKELLLSEYGPDDLEFSIMEPYISKEVKNNEYPNKVFILKSKKSDVKLTFSSNNVIDETNLFDRGNVPGPIKSIFQMSTIDPTYTRFLTETELIISEKKFEGEGILEVMDLR